MALIKCPECGRQVSDKASSCPQCGCPISGSSVASKPTTAQIRVVCKTNTIKVDGKSTSHGSIVTVNVNGSRSILLSAWGGAVGAFGSSVNATVVAGHKYDLDVHMTITGRMLYLKEVSSFV